MMQDRTCSYDPAVTASRLTRDHLPAWLQMNEAGLIGD
jgi:hypothetical protein